MTASGKLKTALRAINVLFFLSLFVLLINPPRLLLPLIAESRPIPKDIVQAVNTRWPLPGDTSFYHKREFSSDERQRYPSFFPPHFRVVITRDHGYIYIYPAWQWIAAALLLLMLAADDLLIGIAFILASDAVRAQFQAQRADHIHRMSILRRRRDRAGTTRAHLSYAIDCCCLAVSCVVDLIYDMSTRPPAE